MKYLVDKIGQWLVSLGLESHLIEEMEELVKILIIIAAALLLWIILSLIFKMIKQRMLHKINFSKRGKERIVLIIRRAIIIFILMVALQLVSAYMVPTAKLSHLLLKCGYIAIIIYIISIANTLTTIIYDALNSKERYKQRPIKGFMQIIQIVLYFVCTIVIIAIIIDKSPLGLLTGLGAFAAVLSFIFKDTILGFVAGIQLTYNDLVRPGDWIVVNNTQANGTVTDISLISVKIENFDNTIIHIPTYSLVNTSFQNWRGMEESEGRRITVGFNIDADTIHFCTPEELDEYGEYIQLPAGKRDKITNLELYRFYLLKMILGNREINKELTLMVRYLPASSEGIPVQIYCFSRDKEWVIYEGIQAAILEQAAASTRLFRLKIYQTQIKN